MHPALKYLALKRRSFSLEFLTSASTDTDASVYTFSSLTLGEPAPDRQIIVGFYSRANAARSISSVTVNGAPAIAVSVANNTAQGSDAVAIYQASVPWGTTGDVVITYSGTMLRGAVGIYRLVGAQPNARSTGTSLTSSSGVFTTTLAVPAGGGAVGICGVVTSNPASMTWSGATEVFEKQSTEANNFAFGGSLYFPSPGMQPGYAITATANEALAGAGFGGFALASWSP